MEINSQVNIKTLSWTAINFRSSKSTKKHSKDVAQSKNPDTSIVFFCTILLATEKWIYLVRPDDHIKPN